MNPVQCEVCAEALTKVVRIRTGLDYIVCDACNHSVLSTGDQSIMETFHASQDKYFGQSTVLIEACDSPFEAEVLRGRQTIVSRFVTAPARLLEVGPGAGSFLRWAQEQGHGLTAVEDSALLAQALVKTTSARVIVGSFESGGLEEASHDVFCSFHVIEHVPDPRAHLAEARRVVRVGGLAFIATPNASSWQQRFFRRMSPNFDSAHLRVFSLESLRCLASEAGWKVIYAQTPEYTSGWLRVVSKFLRKLRGEDEEVTAGKYLTGMSSRRMRLIVALIRFVSWPMRAVQTRMNGGNEILLVLRRDT